MYQSEHRRMKPVLEAAKTFDIAKNPAPEALFEAGNSGFQIWCTPANHPEGWENVSMCAGTFAKPCDYIASVLWGWEDEKITHLILSTDAYAIRDQDVKKRIRKPNDHYRNRPEDMLWAAEKVYWLFEKAGVEIPDIRKGP